MSTLHVGSRATQTAPPRTSTSESGRGSGGALPPLSKSGGGLASRKCKCLQRFLSPCHTVTLWPPPKNRLPLHGTARWHRAGKSGRQHASYVSRSIEMRHGRSESSRFQEDRESREGGRSGGRRRNDDFGGGSYRSATPPWKESTSAPRRFERPYEERESGFEYREQKKRPLSRGDVRHAADGYERREGGGRGPRTAGRGGRGRADGSAQRFERQDGRDPAYRDRREGRRPVDESRTQKAVKEDRQEIRSWAQLRALGAPTLAAFRPKPSDVKPREELDREGSASPSRASVPGAAASSADSQSTERSVPGESLRSYALADDSLEDPEDAHRRSEMHSQQSEDGQPSGRRIVKEVWRPGIGKVLEEERIEDWEAQKEARVANARLLIQELLLLGGRDSPWEVLNALAPGLRPYDYSKIIKQLGQQDSRAGWVRALQTFLWVQAHDPSKTTNRVYTAIIDSLGRAGQLEIAITLWEDMGMRGIPRDTFITNVMLSTLVRSRDYQAALELFQEVHAGALDGSALPDVFTYGTVIDACARGGLGLDRALGLFREMIAAGIAPDIVVCNNILRACAEEGAFGEAANFIDTMKASGLAPNVVSYNILLDAFCKRTELDKAFEVFQEMKREGVPPDFVVYRTLADALRKQGFWEDAELLYDEMNRLGLTPATISRARSARPGLHKQSSLESW